MVKVSQMTELCMSVMHVVHRTIVMLLAQVSFVTVQLEIGLLLVFSTEQSLSFL